VELEEVEVIGLQTLEALLYPGPDVVAAVVVRQWSRLRIDEPFGVDRASGLRRKEELVAPVRDRAPDLRFARAIVDGCVDEVDPGVENPVQDLGRLTRFHRDRPAVAVAPQFHRAKAEDRDVHSGAAERPLL
jgi:hypothetical protein